ncbi:MAG: hypothetical protein Alpg2KO_19400 [Alphaproteobacteria bacterium]
MLKQNRRRGATLLAYGLAVGLIAVVALTAVTNVGDSVNNLMTDVSDNLASGTASADGSASPSPTPVQNFSISHTPNESFYTLTMPGQGPGSTCTATHSGGTTGINSYEPPWDCSDDIIGMKVRFPHYNGNYGGENASFTLNTTAWANGLQVQILNNGTPIYTESNALSCSPVADSLIDTPEFDEDCNARFGESTRTGDSTYSLNPVQVQYQGSTYDLAISVPISTACLCLGPDDGYTYTGGGGGGNSLTQGTYALLDSDCNISLTAPNTAGIRLSLNCDSAVFR